jgi:hypothetical protein
VKLDTPPRGMAFILPSHNKIHDKHLTEKVSLVKFPYNRKRLGSRETKGNMVAMGLAWEEQGGYGLVGHVTGYRKACCCKDSDAMRGSRSGYGIQFLP